MLDEAGIQLGYNALYSLFDERVRRRFATAEAKAAGRGGVMAVSRIAWLARSTIIRGLAEFGRRFRCLWCIWMHPPPWGWPQEADRDRYHLLTDLREPVEPTTHRNPEAPLPWTSRSLRNLAAALRSMRHRIGHNVVADLLRQLNNSSQTNQKTREGSHAPDRDAQSDYIMAR